MLRILIDCVFFLVFVDYSVNIGKLGQLSCLQLLQIVLLMIATYRLFCNPVDHFAETFRSLWFLFLHSNESCHLVFVMLQKNLESFHDHDYKTRDDQRHHAGGREMLTAHLAGLLPIFTSESSPQKSGGNPHHVTTHKSASAACGHNVSTSRRAM